MVGHLNRSDVWLALNTTVMKSLEYPLLATTISIKECTYIMAPILSAGLPNAGMCRNMARSLVYGPSKYQGLDIHNLYTTQGITHLAALVDHIWRDTDTGKLMIISLENMKLELGIQGSVFNQDYENMEHLCEDTWLKHVWEFMHKNGIEISDDIPDYTDNREFDTTLTSRFELAFDAKLISKGEWRMANLYRKYLQVMNISDLATADGKYVADDYWGGTKNGNRVRDIIWPIQGKPKSSAWTVWRRLLNQCMCSGDKFLRNPVGRWLEPIKIEDIDQWDWF